MGSSGFGDGRGNRWGYLGRRWLAPGQETFEKLNVGFKSTPFYETIHRYCLFFYLCFFGRGSAHRAGTNAAPLFNVTLSTASP
jgi:hypothetical protein